MSETVTMTLTEFLLARIAEDEALLPDAGRWVSHNLGLERWEGDEMGGVEITRTRLAAECEAKRRIVVLHRGHGFDQEWATEGYCGECEGTLSAPCATVRLLGLPYVDHADYREEWKP